MTAFITDTAPGVVAGQLAGLELRHRQHARVEDRIRQAKATGLRNLPCQRSDANAAWLEILLAATDLVAWSKLIGFIDHPDLATCEIDTFRYRVLHVAARITRGARQIRLRMRRHLAMGQRHRPRMATTPGQPSPDHPAPRPTDPSNPTGPGKPAHRATPANSSYPHVTISPASRPAPAHPTPQGCTKNRG